MKAINISIILISSSIATAMNPTAWSQHVKNWNETDFVTLNAKQKKAAQSELTTIVHIINKCCAEIENNKDAIKEAREKIERTTTNTKNLIAPLLSELEHAGNLHNIQTKLNAVAIITNKKSNL